MSPSQPALPPATPPGYRKGRRVRLQCAGAGLVVAVAAVDLLRWHAYPASWTHFGSLLPMSPALSGLLVLLGVALGLNLLFPTRPWPCRIAIALAALVVAGATETLLFHLGGREPFWEIWIGPGELAVTGHMLGHLSAQSAVLVLLSCLALIGLHSTPDRRGLLPGTGIVAALLVWLFALVAVLCYAVGNPPMTNDGWLNVAPLAMAEFTLFNVALLLGNRATNRLRHWFFGSDLSEAERMPISREEKRVFSLLMGVGLVGLVAGVVYLRFETKAERAEGIGALLAMADLKTDQISDWRRERLSDARTVTQSPFLARAAQSAINASLSDVQRTELAAWLNTWAQNYGYTRVVLLNLAMEPVLAGPGDAAIEVPGLREQLRSLRADSGVVELPPYVDRAGVLRWDLIAPLRASGSATLDGVILLQTNPTRFLIPILQSWSDVYPSGQSVLWYRDGDLLVSLGGYRQAQGVTADELRPFGTTRRISELSPLSLPAQVLRGELEWGEGPDYRGVPIIGLGRGIPDAPWLFSSRVDSSEIYAPLQRTALGLAGGLTCLLATAGLGTSWLWRQRQKGLLHERLAAELEQKRLEARLGLVMRHAKDIIMVTDENTRFVDVNQQAVDAYGWTREELLQKGIADIRAPETLNNLPVDLGRADSGKGVTYETIGLRRDGTTFPMEVSFGRIDVEGRLHRLAIIRDITERKQAETKLRESQERFTKAFQANPSGVLVNDFATGLTLEVNESFCRIMGFSPQEVVGHSTLELGIWGNAEERNRAFKPLAEGRALRNFELSVRTKKGEPKIVLLHADAFESNGRRCIVGVIEDITARRQAESKLRDSEERFAKAFRANPSGIAISELASGQYIEVNESFCRMLGRLADEILGHTSVDLGVWDRETRQRMYDEILTGRPIRNREMQTHKRNGETIIALVSVERIELNGQTCLLSLLEDITERRQAEAKLRDSQERFAKAFQSNPSGISIAEFATGRFIEVNESFCRILQSTPDEIIGRTSVELGIWENSEERRAAYQSLAKGASIRNMEMQTRRRNGELATALVSYELIELNGQPCVLALTEDITERKNTEAALRASEERYRLIAENTSDVIWLYDLAVDGFSYLSPGIQNLLGYTPAEMLGRKMHTVQTPAGAENARRALESRLADFAAGRQARSSAVVEVEQIRKDGSIVATEVVASVLADATGRPTHVLGVSRDVTERKRTEAALRTSEERYRLIAENSSDIIWLYDLGADGYSYISPAVFNIRGYQPEEVLGQKLTSMLPPAIAVQAQQMIDRELAAFAAGGGTRHSLRYEIEQTHKAGHLVPAEVVTTILADATGRPTHLLGISRDITERQQARKTLEKFNAELEQRVAARTAELAARTSEIQALLDSIPDTVLLCDGSGAVIFTHSPAARESAPPFAVPGGPGRPEQLWREIAREMHALFRAANRPVLREFERPANDTTVSLEARATSAGSDRLLIFLRDISARKRIERDVLANFEREKQLSDMKSQFISVASHEFRTPLAAAVGSLDLLERHATRLTEAKRNELLGRARGSLERLTEIMDDVLRIGRADSGRLKVARMNVALGRFVQDVINEVTEADRHQHTFAFHQSGGPEIVPVDTSLLNHVISNLAGNAARYSPAGTTISVTLAIDPRAFVLTVADEGIGIPEAERERVFEPFVRGSNVGQIGGTGLGLNIVKRYTELMGGTVELLAVSRGTAFCVRVPCATPPPTVQP